MSCLLFVVWKKDLRTRLPFMEQNRTSRPLLQELFMVVSQHRKLLEDFGSIYCGKFINLYEAIILMLFRIAEELFEKLAIKSYEHSRLSKIVIDCIETIDYIDELRLFARNAVYKLIHLVAHQGHRFEKSDIRARICSEEFLQHLIESDEDVDTENLYLVLRSAKKYFQKRFENKDAEIRTIVQLKKTFQAYQTKIQEPIMEPNTVKKLKHIGLFLLKVLNIENQRFAILTYKFVSPFLIFLANKCSLDSWDCYLIHEYLISLCQKMSSAKRIMSEESIYRILATFGNKIIEFRRNFYHFLIPSSIIVTKEITDKVFNVLTPNLDAIESSLSCLWVDWSPSNSISNEEFMDEMTYYHRRYIYFVEDLSVVILNKISRKEDEYDDCEKLKIILKKINSILLNPIFILGIKGYDFTIFKKQKEDFNSDIERKFYMPLTLCEVLKARMTTLNEEVSWNTQDQADFEEIMNNFQTDSSKKSLLEEQDPLFKKLSKHIIETYSLLVGLYNYVDILVSFEHRKFEKDDQSFFIKSYKKLFEPLAGFISNIIHAVSKLKLKQNDENKASRSLVFVEKLKESMQSLLRPLSSLSKSFNVFAKFYADTIVKHFQICGNLPYSPILSFMSKLTVRWDKQIHQHISKEMLSNPKTLRYLLQRISKIVAFKMSSSKYHGKIRALHSEEINEIKAFIKVLRRSFDKRSGIKGVREIFWSEQIQVTAPFKFITDLFLALADEIKQFPFIEMLSINDKALRKIFSSVLCDI